MSQIYPEMQYKYGTVSSDSKPKCYKFGTIESFVTNFRQLAKYTKCL
jgi:hypothetical protein